MSTSIHLKNAGTSLPATGVVQRLPGGYVYRREQIDGAVALVGNTSSSDHAPGFGRQRRLPPI
jgi:hypothetical protein